MQELANHVDIESGLVDLGGSRGLCHWMTIVPADFDRVNKVMVFFHGFSDHVGANYQNMMLTCVTPPTFSLTRSLTRLLARLLTST
jgi:hypothetical protein